MDSGALVKQVTATFQAVSGHEPRPSGTVPQRCPNLAHHRTSQYNSASRSPLVGVRSAVLAVVGSLTSTADSCFVGPILFLLGPISGAFPNRLWSRVPQTAPDQVLCSHRPTSHRYMPSTRTGTDTGLRMGLDTPPNASQYNGNVPTGPYPITQHSPDCNHMYYVRVGCDIEPSPGSDVYTPLEGAGAGHGRQHPTSHPQRLQDTLRRPTSPTRSDLDPNPSPR